MRKRFDPLRSARRLGVSTCVVAVLLAATASRAEACFFQCIYEFGFFTVKNGELIEYNGCTEVMIDGQRYITCYYTSALN
jgi:hypothetical protein